jgi:DNA polymerase zeta
LAKKRYIGLKYETKDQLEPELDSKGVETVRRDGCRIVTRIFERCCKLLFEFGPQNDYIKDYVVRECIKLVNNKVNLKELIIAKEYRGRDTYSNAKSVAACQVANRTLAKDPQGEPLTGERVPYVIVYGTPGLPLYELIRSPNELLTNSQLLLNYEYYILKQILPPIDRILCLVGKNVFEWVNTISFRPRITFSGDVNSQTNNNRTSVGVMNRFIYSTDCLLCGKKCDDNNETSSKNLCAKCLMMDQFEIVKLEYKLQMNEKRMVELNGICQLCLQTKSLLNQINFKNQCCSIDCENTFEILNVKKELKKTRYIRDAINDLF